MVRKWRNRGDISTVVQQVNKLNRRDAKTSMEKLLRKEEVRKHS